MPSELAVTLGCRAPPACRKFGFRSCWECAWLLHILYERLHFVCSVELSFCCKHFLMPVSIQGFGTSLGTETLGQRQPVGWISCLSTKISRHVGYGRTDANVLYGAPILRALLSMISSVRVREPRLEKSRPKARVVCRKLTAVCVYSARTKIRRSGDGFEAFTSRLTCCSQAACPHLPLSICCTMPHSGDARCSECVLVHFVGTRNF